jgi:hypothetical protein
MSYLSSFCKCCFALSLEQKATVDTVEGQATDMCKYSWRKKLSLRHLLMEKSISDRKVPRTVG